MREARRPCLSLTLLPLLLALVLWLPPAALAGIARYWAVDDGEKIKSTSNTAPGFGLTMFCCWMNLPQPTMALIPARASP